MSLRGFVKAVAISFIFIRETQISKTQCIEICKFNNPTEGGGFNTPQLCCGRSFQSLLCVKFHTLDFSVQQFNNSTILQLTD